MAKTILQDIWNMVVCWVVFQFRQVFCFFVFLAHFCMLANYKSQRAIFFTKAEMIGKDFPSYTFIQPTFTKLLLYACAKTNK